MIVTTALMCMALNVFNEARGESFAGQLAVATVTMNRAKTEDRVCKTVFAHRQFSWTIGTKIVSGGYVIPKHSVPKDTEAWLRAVRVAEIALSGKAFDFSFGAKHYHADYVSPRWADAGKMTSVVGRHLFYRNIK